MELVCKAVCNDCGAEVEIYVSVLAYKTFYPRDGTVLYDDIGDADVLCEECHGDNLVLDSSSYGGKLGMDSRVVQIKDSAAVVLFAAKLNSELEHRKMLLQQHSADPEADPCELRCLESHIDGLELAVKLLTEVMGG